MNYKIQVFKNSMVAKKNGFRFGKPFGIYWIVNFFSKSSR